MNMKHISNQKIFPDETIRQWFFYAAKRKLFSLLVYTLLFAVGVPAAGALPMLCYLLAFSLLRKYIGGFHASSMVRCLSLSLLQTLICAYGLFPVLRAWPIAFTVVFLGIAWITVFHLAPIPPKQLRLDAKAEAECKRRSRQYMAAEVIVLIFLGAVGFLDEMCFGSLGAVCAASSLWIEKYRRNREENHYEQCKTEVPGESV